MTTKKTTLSLFVCLLFFYALLPLPALAANEWLGGLGIVGQIVPNECLGNAENCNICSFLVVLINLSKLLLGTFGGIALIGFMWGSFGYITAAGNSEKIQASTKVIWSTITGVGIILLAWVAINLITGLLTGEIYTTTDANFTAKIFNQPWQTVGELCK